MDITEHREAHALVIAPAGRIDMQTADSLRSYLMPRVEACGKAGQPVVLDFASIDYISSAGLRVLMLAAKGAKSAGGTLSVANLQPMVREIFEISRFDKILPCFAGVTEAVAAAPSRPGA
jgi:anti-sigma B factor antagonist